MVFLRAKISTVTRSTGPHPIGLTCAGAGFAAGGAALVAMPAVGLSEARRGARSLDFRGDFDGDS
jgi:hypothetical protein